MEVIDRSHREIRKFQIYTFLISFVEHPRMEMLYFNERLKVNIGRNSETLCIYILH